MRKVRLPGWRPSAEETRRAVELYHQGYTVPAIAIRFGRCEDWVRTQVAMHAANSSTSAMPTRAVLAMAATSL